MSARKYKQYKNKNCDICKMIMGSKNHKCTMQLCKKCDKKFINLINHNCSPVYMSGFAFERICFSLKEELLEFVQSYYKHYRHYPVLQFNISIDGYRSWSDVVRCYKSNKIKKYSYTASYISSNNSSSKEDLSIIYEVIDPLFDHELRYREVPILFEWSLKPYRNVYTKEILKTLNLKDNFADYQSLNGGSTDTDLPIDGYFNYYRNVYSGIDSDLPDGVHTNHLGGGGNPNTTIVCRIKPFGTYMDILLTEKYLKHEATIGYETYFSLLPMDIINIIVRFLYEMNAN